MIQNLDREENSKENRFWYALYTRPRFESKVEQKLKDLNVDSFLPTRLVTKYWSDRKKVVLEPLFPSYVFVLVNCKERYLAYQPPGVVRIVSFNGQPARIPAEQINAVRRILGSGYSPDTQSYFFKGDRVEIISGSLVGLRGFINECHGNNYFIVSIDGIRQSISIKIDAQKLKSIARNTTRTKEFLCQ